MHTATTGSSWIIGLAAIAVALVCSAYLVFYTVLRLWTYCGPGRCLARPAARLLPLIGMSLVVSASAWARERRPVPHLRSRGFSHAPPWSDPGGFPPPRPPGRAGAEHVPWSASNPTPRHFSLSSRTHDTIARDPLGHMSPTAPSGARDPSGATPGTEDAGGRPNDSSHVLPWETDEDGSGISRDDRTGARNRLYSGGSEGSRNARTYRVRHGDTLWSIAAQWLDTDDVSRIARYWPLIHRANRQIIGTDPNLIRPGQVLAMPVETDRAVGLAD